MVFFIASTYFFFLVICYMNKKQLLKFARIAVILFIAYRFIVTYRKESFTSYDPRDGMWETLPADRSPWGAEEKSITPQPSNVTPKPVPGWTGAPPAVSTDLLPKEEPVAAEFGQFAPKGDMLEQNLIDASKLVGVDTVGSSLKNANYSLRRDPVIPKKDVGPWISSSYTPDLLRKPLGDC